MKTAPFSRAALLALAGMAAAGCVELPQLPSGQDYPSVMSNSEVQAAISSATAKAAADRAAAAAAAALAASSATAQSPAARLSSAPAAGTTPTDALITNTLVSLAESSDRFHVDVNAAQGTPIAEILSVGSPIGYELRTRYLNIGIPIGEALSRDSDPVFRERLKDMARWDSNSEVRPTALIVLARQHDPASLDVFREALIHLNPAVRFGALEALLVWGYPDKAVPLLDAASVRDSEPILRVYAAGGMARLGAPQGLERLRAFLNDASWLVRCMAARYLGEYGAADDYRLIVSKIGGETGNDFVVAEDCIAALKLFPKTVPGAATQAPSQTPAQAAQVAQAGQPAQPAQSVEDLASMELEALVITAPRAKITPTMMLDPQINSNLLRLLRLRQEARPDSQAVLDASLGNLAKLTTPTAFLLRTRYTELGFLLVEGLAGASDMQIQSELENTVRAGTNVQIRAGALVALAYTHDQRFIGLCQTALTDQNVTVRLGALEALVILGGPSVPMTLGSAARSDLSLTAQLYAASAMWRLGDVYGREILLRLAQNQDWYVRALATRYLGEQGGGEEYRKLLQWLPGETHQAVRAELCSALLNLKKYADR